MTKFGNFVKKGIDVDVHVSRSDSVSDRGAKLCFYLLQTRVPFHLKRSSVLIQKRRCGKGIGVSVGAGVVILMNGSSHKGLQ